MPDASRALGSQRPLHGPALALFGFLLAATMIVACRDALTSTVEQPSASRPGMGDSASAQAALEDIIELSITSAIAAGKCTGTVSGTCTVTYTAAPADWHCGTDLPGHCNPSGFWQSITGQQPTNGHYPGPQTATITLVLSKPVWGIVLRGRLGAFLCTGTIPTVSAYNGNDSLVYVDTMIPEIAWDCGGDQIGGALLDTIEYSGAVKKLVITAPSPWTWLVDEQDAWAKLFYSQEYYQLPPGDTCLTGDALLDTPEMRKLLRSLRDSSNWDDTVKSNRRERGGYLFQLPSGDLKGVPFFSTTDKWCTAAVIPTPPTGATYLAGAHTHPFTGLEVMPSTACLTIRPGGLYDPRPSGGDIGRLRSDSTTLGYPLRSYVVDKDSIYAMPPGTTRENRTQKVVGYPIVNPVTGCHLL